MLSTAKNTDLMPAAVTKSPIEELTDNLRNLLLTAHENMQHLERRLEPVRSVAPTGMVGGESIPAASPLEGVLSELVTNALNLNTRICELRAELRI